MKAGPGKLNPGVVDTGLCLMHAEALGQAAAYEQSTGTQALRSRNFGFHCLKTKNPG